MKNQNGITLIALVITIIVLLILAGVAIAMLSGDNGILSNATKSSDYNKIGEIKDEMALTVNEYTSYFLDHKYNNSTIPTDVTTDLGDITEATGVINKVLLKYATKYPGAKDEDPKVEYTDGATTVTVSCGKYKTVGTIKDNGVEWGNIIDK
ncbi:MAG: prepilin-type N-terminal cleavage/methylation domain-containing protein [Clostridia bacterium]|nr:prepilin-type N-terminal cleavage/methylation domain-containing protein [Clostridia bacterium]